MKELRNRFIQGKTPLTLSKVHDIHSVCGLLKDFLRRLKEPLITFRLHRTFMEASGMKTEGLTVSSETIQTHSDSYFYENVFVLRCKGIFISTLKNM